MKEYTELLKGVYVKFTPSKIKNKKLKATFINPKTGKINNIHFGDSRYQHYYDKTGLLDKKYNHLDNKRRELYKQRHKNDNLNELSPGFFSMYILW